MRLGRSFYLGDLHDRLVARAELCISRIHWRSRERGGLEEIPSTAIAVVGNRQRLDAFRAQPIHPGPQVFRIERIVGG
jgi:hypothetical protein